MTEITPERLSKMNKIALVIDSEVVDILYADERLASILLSNPLIIDIDEKLKTEKIVVGYFYDADSDTFVENL